MKRKGAEGLPAGPGLSPAANEEFAGIIEGEERLERPRAGWDPYEVWRTRVRATSRAKHGREGDPLR